MNTYLNTQSSSHTEAASDVNQFWLEADLDLTYQCESSIRDRERERRRNRIRQSKRTAVSSW